MYISVATVKTWRCLRKLKQQLLYKLSILFLGTYQEQATDIPAHLCLQPSYGSRLDAQPRRNGLQKCNTESHESRWGIREGKGGKY